MRMRLAITAVTLFLASFGVFATGCRYKLQQFQDKNASGGELRSPLQKIFAHLSEEFYIKVNGKTFKDVRGTLPFYLEIPQLHSILFVTGKMDCPARFHVCDLKTKREKIIEGGPVGFGWDIGGSKKQGEPWTVSLVNATTNKVTLAWKTQEKEALIVLNLNSGRVQMKPTATP